MRSSWRRTSSGVFVDDVGLGLRMQDNQESCSKRSVMAMSCNLEPAAHELSSSSCRPKLYGTSDHVTCFGDINDVVSASGTGTTDAITVSKSLQYPYFTSDSSLFTFDSSGKVSCFFNVTFWLLDLKIQGRLIDLISAARARACVVVTGEMTPSVNERVLFTAAQWQELERQTTIYNYMMASVPVPPELLMPITKNQSNVLPPKSNSNIINSNVLPPQSNCRSLELGIPSLNSSDPEPWRCKRTDGKKWRCSRDVAPDQKYCESLPVASNHSPEWQHLKRDGIKGNGKVCNLYREEQPLCSNTYRGGHSLQAQRLNDHCSMFSSPKSNSLERALNPSMTEAQETRQFIDAWSTDSGRDDIGGTGQKSYVSSSEKLVLPHSALALSSGTRSESNDEGNGSPQLSSFGIMGSWDSHHQSVSGLRPQWMTSHGGSWMVSPPGGPLAEALCLGISSNAKTASNLPSPCSSSCGPNVDQNQLI
ncbi:hypothetical protein DKX38_000584 [Salix brachista]|uniref:Growth-regulating factor n=1 Tax=Salix brachista TaxID=2182728 RepID=A0A5N5P0W0_9ROSI|nr:hypothetical protein DKX38_000584 [Salix brachista]